MTTPSNKTDEIISSYYDLENNIHERISLEARQIKSINFKHYFEDKITFYETITNSIKIAKRKLNHIYPQEHPLP